MAKTGDREHFQNYREQTQVKHDILAAYLPAYFHILKGRNKNILYIDGFAGRGTYTKADTGEIVDGSPLRALKLIAGRTDFAEKVSTVFIEADDILFLQLEKAVKAFFAEHNNIREPECIHGTFADKLGNILEAVKGGLAPTFLFVDPCGVGGASFNKIRDVMNCEHCEAFIFFNIDGVRRIAGLDVISPILIELMGSNERAQSLYNALRATNDVPERERLILTHYRNALNGISVKYTTAFRIEHEDRKSTSHYLIHATKHPLGFCIMKDVMWRLGQTEDQEFGLEFAQASRTNFYPLFDFQGDEVKSQILKALNNGPLLVAVFCKDWVCRPNDTLCEPAYKKALLELETAGKIQVLSKTNQKIIVPATARPKKNGKATLANDYFVQLRNERCTPYANVQLLE